MRQCERTDQADVHPLFDDHVAFRADIGVGIASGRLAPFRYFGLQDDTNYQNIPWHNGRFDAEELGRALATPQSHNVDLAGWSNWDANQGGARTGPEAYLEGTLRAGPQRQRRVAPKAANPDSKRA